MYITYDEYKKQGGKLDETAFNIYSYEAYKKICVETNNRINSDNPGEAVIKCMVRIIDLISDSELKNENVSSFSHDGLSQTFEKTNREEFENEINNLIYIYLIDEIDEEGTPLLYKGVG